MDWNEFFNRVIRPDETLPKYLRKVDVREADKTFAIMGGIVGLVVGIAIALIGFLASYLEILGPLFSTIFSTIFGLTFVSIILFPILFAIAVVLSSRVNAWLQSKFAGLISGRKGSFENTYYLASKLLWPLVAGNTIIQLLQFIPFLWIIVSIAWFFYVIYLACTQVAIANKITKGQALIALVVELVVVGIVFVVVAGALSLLFIGVIGSAVQ